jgi:hypothetical protein
MAIEFPLGTIVAWAKSFTGVPSQLPDGWAECNGQDSGLTQMQFLKQWTIQKWIEQMKNSDVADAVAAVQISAPATIDSTITPNIT